MSNKYIIKNCECKVKGKTTLCVRDIPYKKCENITDCLLKQIVELAKGYKEELIDRKTKKVVATRYFKLTKEILELLDIQEIK